MNVCLAVPAKLQVFCPICKLHRCLAVGLSGHWGHSFSSDKLQNVPKCTNRLNLKCYRIGLPPESSLELPMNRSTSLYPVIRVVSWNVNGLRAICAKSGGLSKMLESFEAGGEI